jgi:hypothetical protein
MAKRRKPSKAFSDRFSSEITVWREGDTTKPDPFFILVINNIALERPAGSKKFVADMSTGTSGERNSFNRVAEYIKKNLFGEMTGQAEKLLSDSCHSGKIKFSSMYVSGAMPNDATALVEEYLDKEHLRKFIKPRRCAVVQMLSRVGMNPDIVFIVSKSPTHKTAWGWGTTDDCTRGGIASTYDGGTITHRFYHKTPGMVGLHVGSDSMTAAHEFGHAFSSYTEKNGFVSDLYRDHDERFFNTKLGRPIPDIFADYKGITYRSDKVRDSRGYGDFQQYHSELVDSARLALMDDFWRTAGGPMLSVHDKMTKAFIMDRIAAKVSR